MTLPRWGFRKVWSRIHRPKHHGSQPPREEALYQAVGYTRNIIRPRRRKHR